VNTNRSHELRLLAAAAIPSDDKTWLANEFYASLSEIANLGEWRTEMNTLPSHWWWHLDKLAQQK
jgi:hypothetical protein